MDNISYFISLFPESFAGIFRNFSSDILSAITEIRLRRGKAIIVYIKKTPYFITFSGTLASNCSDKSLTVGDEEFDFITDRLCNRSFHTNMHTMVDGYITAKNGSRVGIASSAVYKDGKISSVRNIDSINIRIAGEHRGCSRVILNELYTDNTPSIIVAGSVLSGKTTFLRDFSRQLSSGFSGKYRKIAIVDERCEIAGGFDVGVNTDVLSGFEKSRGIEIATRTLSPDIIVCDEIGNIDELEAIRSGFSTGVSFAVSVHFNYYDNAPANSILSGLIETGQFDYIVLLKSFTDKFEIIDLRSEKFESSRNGNDNSFFVFPWSDGSGV